MLVPSLHVVVVFDEHDVPLLPVHSVDALLSHASCVPLRLGAFALLELEASN